MPGQIGHLAGLAMDAMFLETSCVSQLSVTVGLTLKNAVSSATCNVRPPFCCYECKFVYFERLASRRCRPQHAHGRPQASRGSAGCHWDGWPAVFEVLRQCKHYEMYCCAAIVTCCGCSTLGLKSRSLVPARAPLASRTARSSTGSKAQTCLLLCSIRL